jgi:hypothetical protein
MPVPPLSRERIKEFSAFSAELSDEEFEEYMAFRCSTTAWSSILTGRSPPALRAATATETASSGSLLRPCPTDSTRTRTWSPPAPRPSTGSTGC